jgi:hypothetical protein
MTFYVIFSQKSYYKDASFLKRYTYPRFPPTHLQFIHDISKLQDAIGILLVEEQMVEVALLLAEVNRVLAYQKIQHPALFFKHNFNYYEKKSLF